MIESELIEDEIYHYVYNNIHKYILKYNKSYIYIRDNKHESGKFTNITNNLALIGNDIRLATSEEKHWLLECEKANKFINKEEALKSFNKPTELTSLPDKWCIKVEANCLPVEIYHWRLDSGHCGWFEEGYIDNTKYFSKHKLPYTEITLDQFKKWVLKEDSNKPEFIVGKWYKTEAGSYVKYKETVDGLFKSSEDIMYSKSILCIKPGSFGDITNTFKEISLEEIQQYLPDGHPDLISKTPDIQALLEEAKRRYSVGTKIKRITEDKEVIINGVPKIYDNGINVTVKNSNDAWLYHNGKWAEIVSEVASKQEYPLYVECIKRYGFAKIGTIYNTTDAIEAHELFAMNWKSVLIQYKHLNRLFKPSTKEAYDAQNVSKICDEIMEKVEGYSEIPERISFYVRYTKEFTEDLYNYLCDWSKLNSKGKIRGYSDTYQGLKSNTYYVFDNWGLNKKEYTINEYHYGVDNNRQGDKKELSITELKKFIGYKEPLLNTNSNNEEWTPKVGDWVVSLTDVLPYRVTGELLKISNIDSNKKFFYGKGVNCDLKVIRTEFRKALPHEIPVIINTVGSFYADPKHDLLSIPKSNGFNLTTIDHTSHFIEKQFGFDIEEPSNNNLLDTKINNIKSVSTELVEPSKLLLF